MVPVNVKPFKATLLPFDCECHCAVEELDLYSNPRRAWLTAPFCIARATPVTLVLISLSLYWRFWRNISADIDGWCEFLEDIQRFTPLLVRVAFPQQLLLWWLFDVGNQS